MPLAPAARGLLESDLCRWRWSTSVEGHWWLHLCLCPANDVPTRSARFRYSVCDGRLQGSPGPDGVRCIRAQLGRAAWSPAQQDRQGGPCQTPELR